MKGISAGAAERVGEFLERGGGLIFFQDREADFAALSRTLFKRIGLAGIQNISTAGVTKWGRIDLQHPLFKGMFDKGGSPTSPEFKWSVEFAFSGDFRTVISFSDGSPFLIERRLGRGRVLIFAVPLDADAGNFIFSGVFAPLIFRSAGYAAQSAIDESTQWTTGGARRLTIPLGKVEPGRLKRPDGETLEINPRPVIDGIEYVIGRIDLPGIFTFSSGGVVRGRCAANIPHTDLTLARKDLSEIKRRIDADLILDADDEDIMKNVYAQRYGRELWKSIIIIFGVLLLAESIIGKSWREAEPS